MWGYMCRTAFAMYGVSRSGSGASIGNDMVRLHGSVRAHEESCTEVQKCNDSFTGRSSELSVATGTKSAGPNAVPLAEGGRLIYLGNEPNGIPLSGSCGH